MFFPQALQTLVYWGWLTPVHPHSQLFTPTHSRSHLLTLTPSYIHHTCSHSLSLALTKGHVVSPLSHPKAPSVSCSPTRICRFLPLWGPPLVTVSVLRAPPHCHCQASQAMPPSPNAPRGVGAELLQGGLMPLPLLSSRNVCAGPVPAATSVGRPLLLNSRCADTATTPRMSL